jgi:D-arabinose 1-dehydrogenase-like Zn-dependent alcohol dehydrogenase
MLRNGTSGEQANSDQVQDASWLDHLIMSNPHGVMQVLARNGYSGYLAPQDDEELHDAAYDFVEKQGELAVIQLLKEHPLYGAISDIVTEEKKIRFNFLGADGEISSVLTTVRSIDYKKVIELLLMLIGAFWVAGKFWGFISK